MTFKKRISALLVAVLMLVTMTGCNGDTSWVASLDDEQLPVGVFLYYQFEAYMSAAEKLETAGSKIAAGEEGFLDQELEGMKVSEYINKTAWESIDRYYGTWQKIEEYGLQFDDADRTEVDEYIEARWDSLSESMLANGVSEASFRKIAETLVAQNKLFQFYYDEGGVEEITVEDLHDVFTNDYVRMIYFAMPYYVDNFDQYLDAANVQKLYELSLEYAERLNAGENFAEIEAEYNAWRIGIDTEYNELAKAEEEAASSMLAEQQASNSSTAGAPTVPAGELVLAEPQASQVNADLKKAFENHGATEYVYRVDSPDIYSDLLEKFFEMEPYQAMALTSDYGAAYYVAVRLDMLESEEQMDSQFYSALAYSKVDDFHLILQEVGAGMGYTRNAAIEKVYTADRITPLAI